MSHTSLNELHGRSPDERSRRLGEGKDGIRMSALVLRRIRFNFDDVDSAGNPYNIAFAIMLNRPTVHNAALA